MANVTTNIFVPTAEIEAFRKKVSKFNKKAANAGSSPLVIETGNKVTHVNDNLMVEGFDLTISSEEFKIGNYELDAIITRDQTEAITVTAFNDKFNNITNNDVDFRQCDHCGVRHSRKTIVKLNDGNEDIQVGKSCVKDYLGVSVSTFDWITTEYKSITESEYDEMGYGVPVYQAVNVLAATHYAVSQFGFVRSTDPDYETVPTKSIVFEILEKSPNSITEEGMQWAENAMVKLQNMLPTNDYEQNLKNIVDTGFCSVKNLGILCSAIVMLQRQEQDAKKMESKKDSEYVGEIKERITFNGEIQVKVPLEGFYGLSMLFIISDEKGNQFKWKCTASKYFDLMVGDKAEITGTVSNHEEYKGIKQTILKRCKTK